MVVYRRRRTLSANALTKCARAFFAVFLVMSIAGASLAQAAQPDFWETDPAVQDSVRLTPVRVDALSRDGLRLAMKHFPRRGAQPVLLIHGLAQNDRGWDSPIARYSFARFLHAQGFDVWVGNLRGAGTPGFRSEMPEGAHHWTIDDYAIHDIPGLVDAVTHATGQKPFAVGHSLAAWALEGYLAGLGYDSSGRVIPRARLAALNQAGIRGLITIAGVYNLRWEHPVADVVSNPIRDEVDYYHSNYELELLARARPLYYVIPELPGLPLGWVGKAISMPLNEIPWVGSALEKLYRGFESSVIATPVLSMFYYPPDSDPEMVRAHAVDGLEDLGPRVIEQLANAIRDSRTSSYYHLDRPGDSYDYGRVRSHYAVPTLMIAGGRDRLASADEIYNDGYLKTEAADKRFIRVEEFGHLDIVTGIHAPAQVMTPVARWMAERE